MVRFHVSIDSERCKGCYLCIEVCPSRLISRSKSINSNGSYFAEIRSQDHCTGCLQCANICPDAAIEIEKYNDEAEKK